MSAHISQAAIDAAHKDLDVSKFPSKRYGCIVSDPPWPVAMQGARGASKVYDLASIETIASMPIPDLLAEDGFLFLWCYGRTRDLAMKIATETWNLKFRGEIIWVKDRLGMGSPIRWSHENILVFSQGKPEVLYKGQPSVERWRVPVEHSRKPDESLLTAMKLCHGPYLELYARRRFPGFDSWGYEAPGGSDLYIPGHPVPGYSPRAYDARPGDQRFPDGIIRAGYEYQPSYNLVPTEDSPEGRVLHELA